MKEVMKSKTVEGMLTNVINVIEALREKHKKQSTICKRISNIIEFD